MSERLKPGDIMCIEHGWGEPEWDGLIAIVLGDDDEGTPRFAPVCPVPGWDLDYFHLGNTWHKHMRKLGHINV